MSSWASAPTWSSRTPQRTRSGGSKGASSLSRRPERRSAGRSRRSRRASNPRAPPSRSSTPGPRAPRRDEAAHVPVPPGQARALAYVRAHEKPVILMFVGVNGTGKTTVIAKLTHLFQKNGLTVVLAAGDTFRAGAIEQIETHAERLGTKLGQPPAGRHPPP